MDIAGLRRCEADGLHPIKAPVLEFAFAHLGASE
jgi:hypothetical protein